jgi:hypothetical protein
MTDEEKQVALIADLLIEAVKNRGDLVATLFSYLEQSQTMLNGLPLIVEAMSLDDEEMRLKLGELLRHIRSQGTDEEAIQGVRETGGL